MSFLNKFSRDTQEVARYARQIAEESGQTYIGSTHFFLGILAQGDNFACSILDNMGFDTVELFNEVKKLLVPEVYTNIPDELVFTPEIKSIFEIAESEMAGKTEWDCIDPIHILFGLLKYKKNSEVKEILKGSGISYKSVYVEYQEAIKEAKEGAIDAADKIFGAAKIWHESRDGSRWCKRNKD